ncbi:MAG: KEOPS complex subunit Cgi121 [Candidatus Bathyarchaeia archaeon]
MDRFHIENYTVYVLGFRDLYIESPASFIRILRETCKPAEIQILRADSILNLEHIRLAILYALKSFERSVNIAKTLTLEILLKIAAEDQIDKALAKSGLKKGRQDIVIIVFSENREYAEAALSKVIEILGEETGPNMLRDIDEEKIKKIIDLFGISEERLKAEYMYPDIEAALLHILLEDMALTILRR